MLGVEPDVLLGVFNKIGHIVAALVSGAALVFSMAPFDQWWIAYIALVPLLLAAKNLDVRQTLLCYALAAITITTGWWYSVLAYSLLAFISILLIMTLSFVAWGLLTRTLMRWRQGAFWNLYIPVLIWVGIERIHTSEWVGVPGNLGITQYSQPLLIQTASLFGIYAVSFVVLLTNNLIACCLSSCYRKAGVSRARFLAGLSAGVLVGAHIVYGYIQTAQQGDAEPDIRVGIIQPVISAEMYVNGWRDFQSRERMLAIVSDLTNEAVESGVDAVFWPEGGNGYLNMRVPELRQALLTLARDNKVAMIIASNDLDPEGRKYNSVFTISREGKLLGRYNKVLLVPGAESDYTPGQSYQPVPGPFGPLGVAICYESNFPSIARKLVQQGAEMLFVSTSDVVFRQTALPLSHMYLSVFRAVENHRWVVHASNGGPSVVVSPYGVIEARTSLFSRQTMLARVGRESDLTLYTRGGYFVPVALSGIAGFLTLMVVSGSLAGAWRKRRKFSGSVAGDGGVEAAVQRWFLRQRKGLLPAAVLVFVQAGVLMVLVSISIISMGRHSATGDSFDAMVRQFLAPVAMVSSDAVTKRFMQAKSNTCGPAVLAYVLSFFGKEVREQELVGRMSISDQGVTMLEMRNLVNSLGFDAIGARGNFSALLEQPLPVIAHINNQHYVAVNKIDAQFLYLFDPAIGHIKVARPVFRQQWSGNLLLVRMRPILGEEAA